MRFIFVLLVIFAGQVIASDDLQFESFTTDDGLTGETVYDAVKDGYGYTWFATSNGLNRFDGYQFKLFKHDATDPYSISGNTVKTLLIDSDANLWVGTIKSGDNKGGLNRFDYQTERFIRFEHGENKQSLTNNSIRAIAQGVDGHLWIATNKGLNQLDVASGVIKSYLHDDNASTSLGHNVTRDLSFDKHGRLWVATWGGGISILNPKTEHFHHIRTGVQGLSNDYVHSLLFDNNDALWVGTNFGLNRITFNSQFPNQLPKQELKFEHYYHQRDHTKSLWDNSILSFNQDRNGVVWIGTIKGLNRWKPNEGFSRINAQPNLRHGLVGERIFNIYKDNQDYLWLTTDKGVNKLTPVNPVFKQDTSTDRLFGDFGDHVELTTALQHNGDLWGGTLNGLYRKSAMGKIDVFKLKWHDKNSLSHNFIKDIAIDGEGNVWVATINGLNRYNKNTNNFERFYHVKGDNDSISHHNVNVIFKDINDILWVGTGDGLNRYDAKTNTFSCFLCKRNDGKTSTTVFSIKQSSDGMLWLATRNKGLVRFDPFANRIKFFKRLFDSLDNLNDSRINDISIDSHGTLWLATMQGLSKYNPATGHGKIIIN